MTSESIEIFFFIGIKWRELKTKINKNLPNDFSIGNSSKLLKINLISFNF